MRRNYESPLGDPSKVAQMFTLLSLKIWCCRYWCLFEWECNDAAFPYWRIYWNKNYGGIITHQGKRIQMQRENVYLIPPNTSFRSHIEGSKKKLKGMNVLGREVRKEDDENLLASNRILHLFIHFNLGIPFDHVDSNVFEIPLNGDQLVQLNTLSLILKNTYTSPKGKPIEFETSTVFLIQSTILGILSQLPENIWNTSVLDNRIAYIAHFIENNIDKNPSNTELAQMCHMTTNSLVRLFRKEKGMPVQKYINQRKVARAHTLLEHTQHSIKTIAEMLGFANRYHFSRIFKQVTGNTPAGLRKVSVLKMKSTVAL